MIERRAAKISTRPYRFIVSSSFASPSDATRKCFLDVYRFDYLAARGRSNKKFFLNEIWLSSCVTRVYRRRSLNFNKSQTTLSEKHTTADKA